MKPLLTAIFLCVCCAAYSATNRVHVTLARDASPSTNVTGYNVYWGTGSRSYSNQVNCSSNLTVTLTNIVPGVPQFFAATAYDNLGLESDYSDECSYTAPLPPRVPSGFALVSMSLLESRDLTNWTELIKTPVMLVGTTNGVKFFRSFVAITNQ